MFIQKLNKISYIFSQQIFVMDMSENKNIQHI